MPLIVAPAEGFDSLVSLDDASAYMSAMGHAWGGTDVAKEIALRRGTQYLLSRYAVRPECINPVHKNVSAACCEAATRALSGALFADVSAQHVESVTVGPITRKMSAPGNGGQVRFAVIDALMRDMTTSGPDALRLVRA